MTVRSAGAAALLTITALLASACSGDGSATPTGSSTPSGTSATSPAKTSTGTGTGSVTTGSVTTGPKNDIAKRKSVIKKECKVTDTGAEASGVVENTTDKDVDFSITVVFTNDKATNVGEGSTEVTARAGKSTPWKVEGKFTSPKTVLCIVTAVS